MKSFLFFFILLPSFFCFFDPTFGNKSYPKYNETALEEEFLNFQNEKEAIKYFTPIVQENKLIGRRVLIQSIKRGWFNISEYLIKNYYNPNMIDLYMPFVEARKKLPANYLAPYERLVFLLPTDSIFLNIVHPCYLWAQDMNFIYLKIKFSPKLDTPGFMEIFRINLTVTSYQMFLDCISLEGDLPVKFQLEITTYKNMDDKRVSWKRTEMGTIEITIAKSPRPYFWKNLLENMFEDPPNQYLWWDMLYEKRKDIEEALILFEARELQREDIDEENLTKEDQRILDLRYIKKRNKIDEENILKDIRNRQYCWDLGYEPKCLVANPLDWHSWFF